MVGDDGAARLLPSKKIPDGTIATMDTRTHDGILSGEIGGADLLGMDPAYRWACLQGVAMIAGATEVGADPDVLAGQVGPGFKGIFTIGSRRLQFVPYFGPKEHAVLAVHDPEPDVDYVLVIIDPPSIITRGWMTGRDILLQGRRS